MLEYKGLPFEAKVAHEKREVEGYASKFGNVDAHGDIVEQGAFSKTVQERFPANLIKFLWQHWEPLGVPVHMEEDDHGLYTVSRVPNTTLGNDALTLMAEGVVDRMSIGYFVVKDEFDHDTEVRRLKEIKLMEYSAVTFAANEAAVISGVKELPGFRKELLELMEAIKGMRLPDLGQLASKDDIAGESKGVVPFQDLTLAGRGRAWNSSAAIRRIRNWADAEEEANERYRRAFTWFDENDPKAFGSYKLPIADVIDGRLKAVPRAIFAAAAAVQGARGGASIPSGDTDRVKNHLSKYYQKMREQFDDDTIIPPWEAQDSLDLAFVKLNDLREHIEWELNRDNLTDGEQLLLQDSIFKLYALTNSQKPEAPTSADEDEPLETDDAGFADFLADIKGLRESLKTDGGA